MTINENGHKVYAAAEYTLLTEEVNPDRNDVKVLDDGSFEVTPLRWWDDASYAAYQSRDLADDYCND